MNKVPQTILAQLGGARFAMLTGATDFTGSQDALTFRLKGTAKQRIKYVRITLTPADLYDVEFMKVERRYEIKTVVKHEGIYAEDLADLFERETGLFTTLSPRKAA